MAQFKILSNRWIIDDTVQRIFRDTTVDSDPKTIANRNSTNELYSALQDRFDEPDMMDQLVPMSAQTPTEYTMLNGWFIDNRSTEFLYGGAIQTSGWAGGVIRAISYNATTAFQASDIGKTITGTTTTDSGIIVDFDDRYLQDDQGVVYIRPDVPATDTFANGTELYTVGASSAAGAFDEVFTGTGNASITGESLWPNPFSLGSIVAYTDLFFYQSAARVVSKAYNVTTPLQWWANGHVDVLINVRELGQSVDNGFVSVLARQGTTQHDFFQSDLSGGGRQPLPLSAATDLNDQVGFREMVLTAPTTSGNWNVGDRIEDDTDASIRGVIVNVAGTNPSIELQYYLIGDPLNDFGAGTGAFSNLDDTGASTAAVAPTDVNGALAGGVTVTVGLVNEDINNGNGSLPYSVIIDPNSVILGTVFQRLKYLLRRGATTDLDVTNYTGVPGEVYKGVEARIDFSAQTGTFTQGELLYDANTGAVGRVVAIDNTNDYVMLGQVKGTFVAGAAALEDSTSTDFATIDTVEVITPVKACALGTLAGGVFFGARGVALLSANLNSADVQNYQIIDNVGDVQIPPNVVAVAVQAILARNTGSHTGASGQATQLDDSTATFQTAETAEEIKVGDRIFNITDGSRGTIVSINSQTQITTSALTGGIDNDWDASDEYAITVGDRVSVFRVDGSGNIIRNTLTSSTGNAVGDADFVCNATIPSDTPSVGSIHVVDVTDNSERKYRYASWTGTTFTLLVPTDSGGNPTANDATNGAVAMDDTTADFTGSAIPVRVGDEIRNSTDGGVGTITAVYEQRLEHTPLAGGTNNDWQTTDTYVINALTQAYDSGVDTAYDMILEADNIAEGGTELSNSLVFDTTFNVRIVVRQGKVILPINGSGQVTSAGLTFPAGRILDTIAS